MTDKRNSPPAGSPDRAGVPGGYQGTQVRANEALFRSKTTMSWPAEAEELRAVCGRNGLIDLLNRAAFTPVGLIQAGLNLFRTSSIGLAEKEISKGEMGRHTAAPMFQRAEFPLPWYRLHVTNQSEL